MTLETAAFVQVPYVNSDHEYFNSAFTSPASPSASILLSSPAQENFNFDSLLQSQPDADLLTTNDTVAVQEYFTNDTYHQTVDANFSISPIIDSANTMITSPNDVVPSSPTLNFDPDFPILGDDILEQALKSLEDFTKFTTTPSDGNYLNIQGNDNSFNFIHNDDVADLAWEESFATLFPSI